MHYGGEVGTTQYLVSCLNGSLVPRSFSRRGRVSAKQEKVLVNNLTLYSTDPQLHYFLLSVL